MKEHTDEIVLSKKRKMANGYLVQHTMLGQSDAIVLLKHYGLA